MCLQHAYAGGIRTFLAVQGPGIAQGAVDHTNLLSIMDILPTVVDLAGIQNKVPYHAQWDGISFATLLQSSRAAGGSRQQQQQQRRQQGAAVDSVDAVTQRQRCSSGRGGQKACSKGKVQAKSSVQAALQDRAVVILGPQCWNPDAVPRLDANRYEDVQILCQLVFCCSMPYETAERSPSRKCFSASRRVTWKKPCAALEPFCPARCWEVAEPQMLLSFQKGGRAIDSAQPL
jgi:hypothetical protein